MSAELIAAAARVQSSWIKHVARATGGRVWEDEGVTCAAKPDELALCFPERLPQPVLDRILEWADERALAVGCWQAGETPADMARTLVACGFEEGWQPHWMTVAARPAPPDPRVAPATEVPEWGDHGQQLLAAADERTQVFVAREEEQMAGFAWIHAPEDEGVAGTFDVIAFHGFRRRGLGRALTEAVSTRAAQLGCTHVVLNATGEGELLYRAMGFDSLGRGRTWWRDISSDLS